MSLQLINHSPDLKRLRDEGYKIEIVDDYLLVHRVPYVNSSSELREGVLVSELTQAGNKTTKPKSHVIHFIGEHPCNKDGSVIKSIKHNSSDKRISESITVHHSFSNKPKPNGYRDYYHKVTRYIDIISAPAISMDSSMTAQIYEVIDAKDEESVFCYIDSNSSRAEIGMISKKLEGHAIGIVGLGGTGSYVLDQLAKTPVAEIHLFDGDRFLQHNAFRSPGAASIEELKAQPYKTDYLADIYSNMHKGIQSHPGYIDEINVGQLDKLDFVFLCIDKGAAKKPIIDRLLEQKISFIDVGLDIEKVDSQLIGTVRSVLVTDDQKDHIKDRISLADRDDDEYSTNIQIADLNALNAMMAVIKWKKHVGFYQDLEKEHTSFYDTNGNELYNEDH